MGDEDNVPSRRRLIAMLSAFGVTPDVEDPSTPRRADTTESGARGSDPDPRPAREAHLRPGGGDSHPEFVLGPDEQGLLRLLEEIARDSPPSRPMPRESSSFGRYVVLKEIDRGGSGILYLGTDPQRNRPVVLKVARPETLDDAERLRRFDFERRVASRLDHPNIVPVHEVGEVDGLPYMAMAYVEGGTLAEWLLGRAPATPRQASRLVREIAGAVGYAHDRGILNLDLKPGNIMLSPVTPESPEDLGVVPLVIDFGLARLLDGGDEAMDGMDLAGTPPYMAPEQVREGSRGCGRAADVHALGVILYELLVGRPPFLGEN
jgi:serine/threonine protein kinase